jgi:hypothetical protein
LTTHALCLVILVGWLGHEDLVLLGLGSLIVHALMLSIRHHHLARLGGEVLHGRWRCEVSLERHLLLIRHAALIADCARWSVNIHCLLLQLLWVVHVLLLLHLIELLVEVLLNWGLLPLESDVLNLLLLLLLLLLLHLLELSLLLLELKSFDLVELE